MDGWGRGPTGCSGSCRHSKPDDKRLSWLHVRNRSPLRLAWGGRARSRVQLGLGGVAVTSKVPGGGGQVAAREAVLLV